jgi:hypothetical protein
VVCGVRGACACVDGDVASCASCEVEMRVVGAGFCDIFVWWLWVAVTTA